MVASRPHENVWKKDAKFWTITYQFHKHPPTGPSLVEITMTISFRFLNAGVNYYLLTCSFLRTVMVFAFVRKFQSSQSFVTKRKGKRPCQLNVGRQGLNRAAR